MSTFLYAEEVVNEIKNLKELVGVVTIFFTALFALAWIFLDAKLDKIIKLLKGNSR